MKTVFGRWKVIVRFSEILEVLPESIRKDFGKQTFGACLISALDLFSVSMVIPILASLSKGNIEKLPLLPRWISELDVNTMLIFVAAVFTTKNVLTWWLSHRQSLFIHRTFVEISERVYTSFFNQSYEDYCRQNSAENARRIKHAPTDFSNRVLLPLLQLITDTVVIICVILFLLWYDYMVMMAIACAMLPVLFMYYAFKSRITSKINKAFREQTPIGNVILSQGIDAFAEAKLYKKEKFFIQRFMSINTLTSRYLATLRTSAVLPPKVFEILTVACLIVLIYFSPQLSNSNLLMVTGVILLAFYKLGPALNRMLLNVTEIQAFSYTIDLIRNAFTETTAYLSVDKKILRFNETISIENLSFRYAGTKQDSLNPISMTIHKGEFFVLDGPSGIGKTTLLNILNGLFPIQSGSITIDNSTLSESNISEWQSMIAYVPQNGIIIDDTIIANIAFGEGAGTANITKVKEVISLAGLDPFIRQLEKGIYHFIGENGLKISGGQRQRLLLARALYRDPQVLIVDEFTNHLDDDNKIIILETLKQMSASGLTIIAATHDTVAKRYADRVFSFADQYDSRFSQIHF